MLHAFPLDQDSLTGIMKQPLFMDLPRGIVGWEYDKDPQNPR